MTKDGSNELWAGNVICFTRFKITTKHLRHDFVKVLSSSFFIICHIAFYTAMNIDLVAGAITVTKCSSSVLLPALY
jgi:hypothetical protein